MRVDQLSHDRHLPRRLSSCLAEFALLRLTAAQHRFCFDDRLHRKLNVRCVA